MTAPLVFLDTETTGLSLDDDIWEFAAIRREADGSETEHHVFLEHNTHKCLNLPAKFLDDHQRRFPASHTQKWHPDVFPRYEAAVLISSVTDGAHIVGAVPNFDTERIAVLLREYGMEPSWSHHLIDVEAMAFGFLWADGYPANIPWKSDELADALRVEPPEDGERHTALGDARWVKRQFDVMTGRVDG